MIHLLHVSRNAPDDRPGFAQVVAEFDADEHPPWPSNEGAVHYHAAGNPRERAAYRQVAKLYDRQCRLLGKVPPAWILQTASLQKCHRAIQLTYVEVPPC